MTDHDLHDRMQAVADKCREKAASYLRTSKAYNCRSNADVKAGLVKSAAVLEMAALWIEEELAVAKRL